MHIHKLEIHNYKSIKQLSLECNKINVIIGKPNTGKSNILEALGLFTLFNNECRISELARFESMYNLFYDNNIDNPVEIQTDMHRLKIMMKENFEVYIETKLKTAIKNYDLYYDVSGKLLNPNPHYVSPVRYYQFKSGNYFYNKNTAFLTPPYGDNFVMMLMKNRELRKMIALLFKEYGFHLVINPQESAVMVQKEDEGIMISYPYNMVSATLQHFVFYLTAIMTNSEAILIFDEPESLSTLEHTKQMAKYVAEDTTNQFFISTHSSRFMKPLLELASSNVSLFETSYENYETSIRKVAPEEYEKVLAE